MERPINKRLRTQAASPVKEVSNLLDLFVNPIRNALLSLTVVVCVVSAVSILVSIYNSMNERKRDIAVMRALGARRDVVLIIVLLESMLIACGGGLVGWLAGHGIAAVMSPMVEARTGISVGFLGSITPTELILVPGLIVLATLAGIVPAVVAYQTNVSKYLSN
jgi:putative ABC transport system permease protein